MPKTKAEVTTPRAAKATTSKGPKTKGKPGTTYAANLQRRRAVNKWEGSQRGRPIEGAKTPARLARAVRRKVNRAERRQEEQAHAQKSKAA